MRKLILLLIFLGCTFQVQSQRITNLTATPFIATLGTSTQVSFNIAQFRLCDSYTTTTNIDHITKVINISVDYNLIASCEESSAIFTEFIPVHPLLEGVYEVKVSLIVLQDGTLNESASTFGLTIIKPSTLCDQNFSTALGPCPLGSFPVCGCDGIQYDNECFAYIEAEIGTYYSPSCLAILNGKLSADFCQETASPEAGHFFTYECSNGYYPGDELIVSYAHSSNVDQIYYESSNEVTPFIISTNSGSIACQSFSNDGIIDVSTLAEGNYQILFDSETPGPFTVSLCNTVNTEESVSPPPFYFQGRTIFATENITVDFFSIDGKYLGRQIISAGHEAILNRYEGLQILQIRAGKKMFVEKLVCF